MLGLAAAPTPACFLFPAPSTTIPTPAIHFPGKFPHHPCKPKPPSHSSLPFSSANTFLLQERRNLHNHFSTRAAGGASSSPVDIAAYAQEPATGVKFQTSLNLPGCPNRFSLLGTGYREKVFAIIGVKVYAAGFYVNQGVLSTLDAWKGKSADEILSDSSLFNSIFEAPAEKSLQIVLVRDVDGKTFWDALNEAISPRLNAPTATDESAVSSFRNIFEGRSLKKGCIILLTWLNTSTLLVSVSPDGLPSKVDAKIESRNVNLALFDVFLGEAPVSPTLKAFVSSNLATILA